SDDPHKMIISAEEIKNEDWPTISLRRYCTFYQYEMGCVSEPVSGASLSGNSCHDPAESGLTSGPRFNVPDNDLLRPDCIHQGRKGSKCTCHRQDIDRLPIRITCAEPASATRKSRPLRDQQNLEIPIS